MVADTGMHKVEYKGRLSSVVEACYRADLSKGAQCGEWTSPFLRLKHLSSYFCASRTLDILHAVVMRQLSKWSSPTREAVDEHAQSSLPMLSDIASRMHKIDYIDQHSFFNLYSGRQRADLVRGARELES